MDCAVGCLGLIRNKIPGYYAANSMLFLTLRCLVGGLVLALSRAIYQLGALSAGSEDLNEPNSS